eukprot:TRINITY_DN49585_c0_g1_i1.p1 TRINITY_DN49585_c0_g1~~TRINITY_DN49585_c0_g1_i1.p1  ORF type:complete len:269 (+),score=38.98 TRINITY_DN49585_c0_g1_i1:133-939(+)
MGCGAVKVKIVTPTDGFNTCEFKRNGSIFKKHGNSCSPPVAGHVMYELFRDSGDILARMKLSCFGTDHEQVFNFTSTITTGDTTLILQVAEPKRSQGEFPVWRLYDSDGVQEPLRFSGHFGSIGFVRVSKWVDKDDVIASSMQVMDTMGDYARDVFVFRGNIRDKADAEAKSQTSGCLLAFVRDRQSDDQLPYQKPVVRQGSGSMHVASELLQLWQSTELMWAVLMLLGISMAGLDAGRRYYSHLGPNSSGDGTGPVPGDRAWGSLIH